MTTNKGPKKYTKKPVTIEAMQWDGTVESATLVINWALTYGTTIRFFCTNDKNCRAGEHSLQIPTLEGYMYASSGDFIIKGVQGEFYPCKPDIFAATYSPTPQTLGEALNP